MGDIMHTGQQPASQQPMLRPGKLQPAVRTHLCSGSFIFQPKESMVSMHLIVTIKR